MLRNVYPISCVYLARQAMSQHDGVQKNVKEWTKDNKSAATESKTKNSQKYDSTAVLDSKTVIS